MSGKQRKVMSTLASFNSGNLPQLKVRDRTGSHPPNRSGSRRPPEKPSMAVAGLSYRYPETLSAVTGYPILAGNAANARRSLPSR
jgi:hypothetical protein